MSERNKNSLSALDDDALAGVAGGAGGVQMTGSGSFMSNTGTTLNLVVNWYAGRDMYGNPGLLVNVCVNSGNLMAGSLLNGVELSVNGMMYTAANNAVNYMGGGMTSSVLASFTIPNISGPVSLTAVWHFNGTYGGMPIGNIIASGTAYV